MQSPQGSELRARLGRLALNGEAEVSKAAAERVDRALEGLRRALEVLPQDPRAKTRHEPPGADEKCLRLSVAEAGLEGIMSRLNLSLASTAGPCSESPSYSSVSKFSPLTTPQTQRSQTSTTARQEWRRADGIAMPEERLDAVAKRRWKGSDIVGTSGKGADATMHGGWSKDMRCQAGRTETQQLRAAFSTPLLPRRPFEPAQRSERSAADSPLESGSKLGGSMTPLTPLAPRRLALETATPGRRPLWSGESEPIAHSDMSLRIPESPKHWSAASTIRASTPCSAQRFYEGNMAPAGHSGIRCVGEDVPASAELQHLFHSPPSGAGPLPPGISQTERSEAHPKRSAPCAQSSRAASAPSFQGPMASPSGPPGSEAEICRMEEQSAASLEALLSAADRAAAQCPACVPLAGALRSAARQELARLMEPSAPSAPAERLKYLEELQASVLEALWTLGAALGDVEERTELSQESKVAAKAAPKAAPKALKRPSSPQGQRPREGKLRPSMPSMPHAASLPPPPTAFTAFSAAAASRIETPGAAPSARPLLFRQVLGSLAADMRWTVDHIRDASRRRKEAFEARSLAPKAPDFGGPGSWDRIILAAAK